MVLGITCKNTRSPETYDNCDSFLECQEKRSVASLSMLVSCIPNCSQFAAGAEKNCGPRGGGKLVRLRESRVQATRSLRLRTPGRDREVAWHTHETKVSLGGSVIGSQTKSKLGVFSKAFA